MHFDNLHPLSIHFPIVLLTILLVLDVLAFFKKDFSSLARWTALLGLVSIVAAMMTGYLASSKYLNSPLLELHKTLSFVLCIVIFIYCTLRWIIHKRTLGFRIGFTVLSTICFVFAGLTAELGGLLYVGYTPFQDIHAEIVERDPYHVRFYSPEEVENFFESRITEKDVLPIFKEHRCSQCHSEQFENFSPVNFAKVSEQGVIWLPRDKEGKLLDWENSIFYQDVILKNTMPVNDEGKRIGLPFKDRLILFKWLENGAPMDSEEDSSSEK